MSKSKIRNIGIVGIANQTTTNRSTFMNKKTAAICHGINRKYMGGDPEVTAAITSCCYLIAGKNDRALRPWSVVKANMNKLVAIGVQNGWTNNAAADLLAITESVVTPQLTTNQPTKVATKPQPKQTDLAKVRRDNLAKARAAKAAKAAANQPLVTTTNKPVANELDTIKAMLAELAAKVAALSN